MAKLLLLWLLDVKCHELYDIWLYLVTSCGKGTDAMVTAAIANNYGIIAMGTNCCCWLHAMVFTCFHQTTTMVTLLWL